MLFYQQFNMPWIKFKEKLNKFQYNYFLHFIQFIFPQFSSLLVALKEINISKYNLLLQYFLQFIIFIIIIIQLFKVMVKLLY